MDHKKRIVIADDHTILREVLKSLLSMHDNLEVVGEARDGLEAIRRTEDLKPDLVLMDLSMPRMDGLNSIQEIRKRCAGTKILVLTVHKSEEHILTSLRSGVHGYVPKDASHKELMVAIHNVLAGKSFLSPSISEKVIEGYLERKDTARSSVSLNILTKREKQILKMVARGYKNKDIGNLLRLSIRTVEKHRSNIMKKLDLHSASSLTAYAIEAELVTEYHHGISDRS